MIFGDRPKIVAREGDKVRVEFDAAGHLAYVQYLKEKTNNGRVAGDMQLMAAIPTWFVGWLNAHHPNWIKEVTNKWDGSFIQKWLDSDDFGRQCRIAEDHPLRGKHNFIIK